MRAAAVLAFLSIIVSGAAAREQPPAPVAEAIVEFGFETDVEGWVATDDTALVTTEHLRDDVKEGVGSLRWEFAPTKGKMPALVAQTGPAPGGQSFSVWAKTTVASLLVVGFQEGGGARYIAPFYCPAGEWRRMETALADFVLSDDTTDDNDTLDPDQIAACMVVDLAGLAVGNPEAAMLLDLSSDPKTVLLDEFRISPTPVARTRGVTELADGRKEITLQTFDSESALLIPMRHTTVESVAYDDDAGRGAALRYDLTGAQFPLAGAIMGVQMGELAGLEKVGIVVRSEQPITLAVMIEEKENKAAGRDKSSYTAMRALKGGGEWETIEIRAGEFKLNDDSSDENGVLDGDQLSMLALLDGSAAFGARTGPNELVIDEVSAVTRP